MDIRVLRRRVRGLLVFFIIALLLSGITAFPLAWELNLLYHWIAGSGSPVSGLWPNLAHWITYVNGGVQATYRDYPFMAYGTDWLAFAHIIIAIAFWGPLKDPLRNIWVIEFGLIACLLVLPLALICGPIRGIPFFWQVIDCSFGIFGFIPLWFCRRMILQIAALEA